MKKSVRASLLMTVLTVLCTSLLAVRAQAHDVPPSAILLDIGFTHVDAELQLPLNDLGLALSLPLNAEPQQAATRYGEQLRAYLRQHVHAHTQQGAPFSFAIRGLEYRRINDSDWIVANTRLQPPAGEPLTSLVLDYDAIIAPVVSHNALLSIRRDFRRGVLEQESKPTALLGFNSTHLALDLSGGSWWRGFFSVFSLGMHHIAEGTDHMLFLLVLLLPAPLVAAAGSWRNTQGVRASVIKIIKIVSGFTLGHSLTLIVGALGIMQVPSQPIEVLIAVSILISAWHAMRPVFANKELYLAAGFGLIHGLAFASSLAGLGYDAAVLASSVLGFNLGIEVMQLLIVAAVLPWLILLSRSRLYTPVRWIAAGFAAIAALGWLGERALDLPNPVNVCVEAIAAHAIACLGVVALLSIAAGIAARSKPAWLSFSFRPSMR